MVAKTVSIVMLSDDIGIFFKMKIPKNFKGLICSEANRACKLIV